MGGANRLSLELERYGIRPQVRQGSRVALVSIGRTLDVWVEWGPQGLRYRWWTGEISTRTGKYVYAVTPAHEFQAVARLIAARCRQLRATPSTSLVADQWPAQARTRPYARGDA